MSRRKNKSNQREQNPERLIALLNTIKSTLGFLLAGLSGLLAALEFPPFNVTWLCWVAWTPLIAAVWFYPGSGRRSLWRFLGLGFFSGAVFFLASLFWLHEVTIGGWIALSLFLGSYRGLWAVFVATVGRPQENKPDGEKVWLNSWNNLRLAILGGAAWAGLEWVRSFLFTGFGWNAQGVALHEMVPLIQIVDIVGVHGLSFLIILVNLMIVITGKRLFLELRKYGLRPHIDLAVTALLVAGTFFYGTRQIFHTSTKLMPVRIACIQAAIPRSHKWDPAFDTLILNDYQNKSDAALRLQPQLLIWPEASTPHPALLDDRDHTVIQTIAQSFPGDFLLGTIHFDDDHSYNSAVLFTQHGKDIQIYSKMHLVPFGEYVPMRHSFLLFAWIVGTLIPSDFTPGPGPVIFSMQSLPLRIAPLICFEDTLGELARRFVNQKVNFFAVIINDGWFGKTSGSAQHLANAVFRTAEFKLPMVRCSNTGVTCFIDRFGFVTQKLRDPKEGTFGPGVLVSELEVPVESPITFYARFGDVFSVACAILASLAAIISLIRRFLAA